MLHSVGDFWLCTSLICTTRGLRIRGFALHDASPRKLVVSASPALTRNAVKQILYYMHGRCQVKVAADGWPLSPGNTTVNQRIADTLVAMVAIDSQQHRRHLLTLRQKSSVPARYNMVGTGCIIYKSAFEPSARRIRQTIICRGLTSGACSATPSLAVNVTRLPYLCAWCLASVLRAGWQASGI